MNISEMERNARKASGFLKSLANEHRLLILCHLARGEKRVGELEELLDMRQPHLSQHLARLRRDGLVRTRRNAREIFYTIGSLEALRTIGLMYEMFCVADGAARPPRKPAARAGKSAAAAGIAKRANAARRYGDAARAQTEAK